MDSRIAKLFLLFFLAVGFLSAGQFGKQRRSTPFVSATNPTFTSVTATTVISNSVDGVDVSTLNSDYLTHKSSDTTVWNNFNTHIDSYTLSTEYTKMAYTDELGYGTDFTSSTALSLTLAAGATYFIEAYALVVTTINTDGINMACAVSGDYSKFMYFWSMPINNTTQVLNIQYFSWKGTATAAIEPTTISAYCRGQCNVVNGSAANTFCVVFGNENATGKTTLKAGSFIRWRRIN